jgi:hypothetical protein
MTVKPTRKLSRSSFVTRVSGGHPARGGALTALIGPGKGGGEANDADLAHPAHGAGADPDSAPDPS